MMMMMMMMMMGREDGERGRGGSNDGPLTAMPSTAASAVKDGNFEEFLLCGRRR
jgi:hypothetical protein